MRKLLVIDDNMEFKVYPFNTLNGYFSADIIAMHKGKYQVKLPWRLQKESYLKKLEVLNLI